MSEATQPAPRTVAASQSEMTEIIFPNDSNSRGDLFGGKLMQYIDVVAGIAAFRHARLTVVTASMDHIDFIQPVHIGDLLILKASVNRVFGTSLEAGVKVWTEQKLTGERKHVASAYLVYVAIDEETGRGVQIPPIVPETPCEIRRYEGALRRRDYRKAEAIRRKQAREECTQLNPAAGL